MTILNISLCLPELDIAALCSTSAQHASIVAITERFMVADKSFVLLPCRHLPHALQAEVLYRPDALGSLKELAQPSDDTVEASYWAQCVSCQQVVDETAIAAIGDRTIWQTEALRHHLQNSGKLFLSFLRVYRLSKAVSITEAPICDQLYKFLPLPQYIEADSQQPVLSNDEFVATKQAFFAPPETEANERDRSEPENITPEDILNSPDWISKISEVGNSSDGHTFEKLVRKGLIALGFSNTVEQPEASLDPEATGGAGGIDFYADQPYSIVGECKATETEKVQGDPCTQLHKLGLKYLSGEDYNRSVKLILAAGKITGHANKIAIGHKMNVLRPETLQALVTLKDKYENAVDLSDVKAYLQAPPFGTDADNKIQALVQQWKNEFKQNEQSVKQRQQVIQTIKALSAQTIHKGQKAFIVVEVRAHYNATFKPWISDDATEEMLIELSSPFFRLLGRKQLPGDRERFYIIQDMPLASG